MTLCQRPLLECAAWLPHSPPAGPRISCSAPCCTGSGSSTGCPPRRARPPPAAPWSTRSWSGSSTSRPPERTPEAAAALVAPEWAALKAAEPDLAALVDDGDEALPSHDSWYAEATTLIERWFTLEDPTMLEPAERELYVEADFDGLVLRGYVDRLDVAPGGAMRVVDYKTGRSPSRAVRGQGAVPDEVLRPGALAAAGRGSADAAAGLPRQRRDRPLQPGRGRPARATERKLKALWVAIERAAETGDWRPSTSRLCDWCDYRALCPAWGGTPPPLPDHASELALDPQRSGEVEMADE